MELHNEDLIDLLAGDADVRPTVQIREDKNGTIIWSGLREVRVASAIEVMNLLTQGSALRQTNSTDMNAQSSRSHAIFSLTLTQRKYTGTGTPPSPPDARKAAHRLSGLPRMTSPTPGARAGTPDRPGSRTGLRPPSAIGNRPTTPVSDMVNGVDSWTTISSKFHFVDLAGSERLKRTAAQGERVKEGISINSGLHALGNVISALGDPARARQTTHIPYRDSKLTRLLQDSLGGNAHTMMVACVSPTELNVSETVSTVKYANRARNIKNSASINEVEVGWNDLDYLQQTITKLRADLSLFKTGDGPAGLGMRSIAENGADHRSLNPKTQALYAETLDLRERCVQLTTELQMAKAKQSGQAANFDYTKMVEPIVEEYERSISALESQLSLTKASVGFAEEEINELSLRLEQEARLAEEQAQVVDHLKLRVARLSEREATTEAYVRDIEAKLAVYDQKDEDHGSAVSELRREISTHRERAATTEQYIKDLEARLAETDNGNAGLRKQIDVLERDIERREESYRDLSSRLTLLDTSGDHKALLAELDEKDRRLNELERSLDELKSKHAGVEQEASRLTEVALGEKEAKEELQSRVRTLERQSVLSNGSGVSHSGETAAKSDAIAALEGRLADLQASQDQTLAQLEEVKVNYRNSLREIDELTSQVSDQKLINGHASEVGSAPPSPIVRPTNLVADDEEIEQLSASALNGSTTLARHNSASSITSLASSTGGGGGSTARSPRARRSIPLASSRLSFLGRGQGVTGGSHSRSASLSVSQDLSLAQQLPPPSSSPTSARSVSPSQTLLSSAKRSSFYGDSQMVSSPGAGERSYDQMKGEVMKLQEALTEREQEINSLELSVTQLRSAANSPVVGFPSPALAGQEGGAFATPAMRLIPNSPVMELKPSGQSQHSSLESPMSPSLDEGAFSPMNDLMQAMAKKDAAAREQVDALEAKHTELQREHDRLVTVSRDQVVNMSSEIGALRASLEARPEASHYDARLTAMEDDLAAKAAQVDQARAQAETDLAAAKVGLVAEHDRVTASLKIEHDLALAKVRSDHEETLKRAIAEGDETLRQKEAAHAALVESLTAAQEGDDATHSAALLQLKSTHDAAVSELVEAHAAATSGLQTQHESAVAEAAAALAALGSAHSAAQAAATAEHDARVKELQDTHSAAQDELRQKHQVGLEAQATALAGEHADKVAALSEQHAGALAEQAQAHQAELEAAAAAHEEVLNKAGQQHAAALAALGDSHRDELAQVAHVHAADTDACRSELTDTHTLALGTVRDEHQAALDRVKEDHATATDLLATAHAGALEKQAGVHQTELEEACKATAEQITQRDEAHAAHQALAAEHDAAKEKLSATKAELAGKVALLRAAGEAASPRGSANGSPAVAGPPDGQFADPPLSPGLSQAREELLKRLEDLTRTEQESQQKIEAMAREFDLSRLELARTKQERDSLAGQVARFAAGAGPGARPAFQEVTDSPFRAGTPDRGAFEMGSPSLRQDARLSGIMGSPNLNGSKPPPPTPPPSMPPPPLPTTALPALPSGMSTPTRMSVQRTPSQSSVTTVNGTRVSVDLTTPATSIRSTDSTPIDPRVAKKFEEHEAALATLRKQLQHTENDLQANLDLVTTLESALNDSERNLRKARQQMNDFARERDALSSTNEGLRQRTQDAEQESETLRQTVVGLEDDRRRSRREEDETKARFERQMSEVDKRKSKCESERGSLESVSEHDRAQT